MDVDLVKASFAIYIVGVSLVRLLDENEYFRVTAMKKIWGRSMGLMLHFICNVLVPMLFALIYLSRAVVSVVTY